MDDNTNNLLVNVSHVSSVTIPSELGGDDGEVSRGDRLGHGGEEPLPGKDGSPPEDVHVLIRDLILRFGITREQLETIYEECEELKAMELMEKEQERQRMEEEAERQRERSSGDGALHLQVVGEAALVPSGSSVADGNMSDGSQTEYQGEINKLQSVVQSAMETYECSPVSNNMTTKRSLTLSDDPVPSVFARELLQRDQSLVAQVIRKYLHQYSIPQREVVEKTAINQSHLSQHFTRGVPIKPAKRIKLYHWFEQDQLQRTGQLLTADGSLTAVLESPKVEGYRRRPRWRWSPVATQILSEAFKKNRFPTREQRAELSRICNEAEAAMNNGEPIQGPSGDTEGITEQRINTWFTNRRKGLITPSPTYEGTGLGITASTATLVPNTINIATPISDTPTPATTSSTLNVTLSTTPSKSTNQSTNDTITLTALSPSQLQSLINQLQTQNNSISPVFTQTIGQSPTVGQVLHLPSSLLLPSSQGPVTVETFAKQIQVEGNTQAINGETEMETNHNNEGLPLDHSDVGALTVVSEEEIISNNISTVINIQHN